MQFLKILFWIVLTVLVVLFADANWRSVEVRLWGGLIADAKLPILLMLVFLLGFLPTLAVYRAKLWALRRRLEPLERNAAQVPAVPAAAASPLAGEERVATDTKVWPPA
jgi:putative membrane protein